MLTFSSVEFAAATSATSASTNEPNEREKYGKPEEREEVVM